MCPVLYTHSQKEQAPKGGSPMSTEDNKAFIRSYFDAIGGTDKAAAVVNMQQLGVIPPMG